MTLTVTGGAGEAGHKLSRSEVVQVLQTAVERSELHHCAKSRQAFESTTRQMPIEVEEQTRLTSDGGVTERQQNDRSGHGLSTLDWRMM
jgi:hypothetical protein